MTSHRLWSFNVRKYILESVSLIECSCIQYCDMVWQPDRSKTEQGWLEPGRRLKVPHARKHCLKRSFIPSAITILNPEFHWAGVRQEEGGEEGECVCVRANMFSDHLRFYKSKICFSFLIIFHLNCLLFSSMWMSCLCITFVILCDECIWLVYVRVSIGRFCSVRSVICLWSFLV